MRGALLLTTAALLLTAPPAAEARERSKAKLEGVVNLNTATVAQLDLLPGVGEKAAKDIIAFRTRQPFKRIEDLVRVKGFGKKRFEKVRAHLTVIGSTTLRRTTGGGGLQARARAAR